MGKGSNHLLPNNRLAAMNKFSGKVNPIVNNTNKAVKRYTGLDITKGELGLEKQQTTNDGISSRPVATSGTTGSIKKVYDKEENKK